MDKKQPMLMKKSTVRIAVIGGIIVALMMVFGTVWMGQASNKGAETAVHAVSLLYLDELALRREQVVASTLHDNIENMQTAIGLITPADLSDTPHFQVFQARMKKLYRLEKFAFVDEDGVIYTSVGTKNNVADYSFNHKTLSKPEISILTTETGDKKVIIAVPVKNMTFEGKRLVVCFMEIDMGEMLRGISMSADSEVTFCDIYTKDGVPLNDKVLGGLAEENNLLDALKNAQFENGYSCEAFEKDFRAGKSGEFSFTYHQIRESLSYVPVDGTDWMLTYLIRESIIAEEISAVSDSIVLRSVVQTVFTVLVLVAVFAFIIFQMRRNTRLILERETAEATNRLNREKLEEQLELEKQRTRADSMITAMASDYRSVYYVNLDEDDAVCIRADADAPDRIKQDVHFGYCEEFCRYGERYVTEPYREGFLKFIKPDSIRQGLEREKILAFRYAAERDGKEYYEMIRVAGVRRPEDRDDNCVHAIGLGFTDIDAEMRETLAQQQALSDALAAAEQANKAKTAFLSSISHEIRTPMNVIIGLDNIALNDPALAPSTKEYLEKIGASAEHLLQLINDILDVSRIESGRMTVNNEEFSFSKLLETINTMFSGQCSEKGIEYHCRINGHVDNYYVGDNMKLRQILINILGNAVKFTPSGGSVQLTVEKTAQFDDNATLQFIIEDSGIGMSEEFLPHIFDTFSQENGSMTNKYGSSGLGMAITKNMVEMLNGNIQVESQKGVGSRFTVAVTLFNSSRSGDSEDFEITPGKIHALIVDDDPIACEHAKLVLETAGIASDAVSCGEEAVKAVEIHRARSEPYNLILIDWQMPGMDGVETTRQIRSCVGDEAAIIILTAYKWDDIIDDARQAGVDTIIAKPLFAANVLDEFTAAMKRRSTLHKPKKKAELNGRRVLIAEDMMINAEIIKSVLQMRGMLSEHAENGKIAVDMFAAQPEGYYDAVLMDMRMPEMDGLEATRQIRRLDRPDAKRIPIIALTANAFDEDVQRSLQAGLNAHLTKPIQPDSLFEALEDMIADD